MALQAQGITAGNAADRFTDILAAVAAKQSSTVASVEPPPPVARSLADEGTPAHPSRAEAEGREAVFPSDPMAVESALVEQSTAAVSEDDG
jgi:hypothetical protein